MQVWVFLVNFISPPTVGALTEIVRVWSPVTIVIVSIGGKQWREGVED